MTKSFWQVKKTKEKIFNFFFFILNVSKISTLCSSWTHRPVWIYGASVVNYPITKSPFIQLRSYPHKPTYLPSTQGNSVISKVHKIDWTKNLSNLNSQCLSCPTLAHFLWSFSSFCYCPLSLHFRTCYTLILFLLFSPLELRFFLCSLKHPPIQHHHFSPKIAVGRFSIITLSLINASFPLKRK